MALFNSPIGNKRLNLLKRVSWSRLTGGVWAKSKIMKESIEQVLKVRMTNIQQDLEMIEVKKERLDADRAALLLKLIAQREQLLALKEQDE